MRFETRLILACAILVPLGLLTKKYSGPGEIWVHHYAGDVLVVAFLIVLAGLFFPGTSTGKVTLGVLLFSIGIEVLQLWQPPWLQSWRATWAGRIILGSTFSWMDLPHYLVGAIGGAWLLDRLRR